MKLRFLACILLPLVGLFSIPLTAQEQPQATPPPPAAQAAPLQIQDNPVPASTPTASLFAPEGQGSVTQPVAPAATNSDTNTPPPQTPQSNDPAAPAADSGMGSPGQNPPPSDPNSLIPPPQEPEQPSPINSAGNEEKQRQDQKARYYTAKVKADKDEELSSLLEKADKAKSDEAKRQALHQYYDLLAKRMKKIDASLSDWIDTMHAAYLRRLEQVRVEPTIPLNPPPSVDAGAQNSATPAPSASPTHKKKRRSALAGAQDSATPAPSSTPAQEKKRKAPVSNQ